MVLILIIRLNYNNFLDVRNTGSRSRFTLSQPDSLKFNLIILIDTKYILKFPFPFNLNYPMLAAKEDSDGNSFFLLSKLS